MNASPWQYALWFVLCTMSLVLTRCLTEGERPQWVTNTFFTPRASPTASAPPSPAGQWTPQPTPAATPHVTPSPPAERQVYWVVVTHQVDSRERGRIRNPDPNTWVQVLRRGESESPPFGAFARDDRSAFIIEGEPQRYYSPREATQRQFYLLNKLHGN
jgi:hypothetical protein